MVLMLITIQNAWNSALKVNKTEKQAQANDRRSTESNKVFVVLVDIVVKNRFYGESRVGLDVTPGWMLLCLDKLCVYLRNIELHDLVVLSGQEHVRSRKSGPFPV